MKVTFYRSVVKCSLPFRQSFTRFLVYRKERFGVKSNALCCITVKYPCEYIIKIMMTLLGLTKFNLMNVVRGLFRIENKINESQFVRWLNVAQTQAFKCWIA